MKKLLFVVLLMIILASVTGIGVYRFNMTPLEVASKDRNAVDGVFTISRVLYESSEVDDKYIIIYTNPRGNVCNVLLEQSWKGYSVVDFNGEMACDNSIIPVGMHFGWYRREEGWVGSGVVYSDAVDKIIIDGEEANIIESDNLTLWYLYGERELDETNTQILSADGSELIQ